MKINEKIKWIRERSGLSQEDMAEKLGLATSTYSKMEQGRINISLQRLEKIASILGMNTVDLLENGGHLVCLVSENNSSNYYGVSAELSVELEHYKLMLQHKDELIEKQKELLEQQKRELAALNEIIALMKGRSS